MSENKHTPEPLAFQRFGEGFKVFSKRNGATFARCRSEEDARRIVACVNACEWIHTEQLEQLKYLQTASYLLRVLDQAQSDKLTAALVRIRDGATNQGAHTGMSWAQVAEIANAAIDGVKSTQATVKESLTAETSTPHGWNRITRPGQVKVGHKLRFTIGDDTYSETAKEILFPGTDREEIIYNKRRNFYLITSMCIANQGSQKNVEFFNHEEATSAPAIVFYPAGSLGEPIEQEGGAA